jgi:serine phosphatase RsbU (regulator of sigma subunit)/pSer/pThr/pTyr-binding forkhead associated (FHA) protein
VTAAVAPRLVVHEGGSRRVVAIATSPFRIGRSADANLQLAGANVSRDHAEIVRDDDRFVLRDHSRAGTFVNGAPITEQLLSHGDEIECGRSGAVLMFLTSAADERRGSALQAADLRPIATLLESLRGMGGERVLDEVLTLVLDTAIGASGAERGFIMLADTKPGQQSPGGGGRLELQLARAAGEITLDDGASAATISRKIPEQVFTSGEAMVVADLLEGDMAAVHTGTVALGIRHVLCVPLRVVRYVERGAAPAAARIIGVLYLDSRGRGRLLSMAARQEIEALAGEAALAIENARLYQEAAEKAKIDRELATASRIQQALLPEPRRTGAFFEAVGASIPSRTIGGDFFDYQELAGGGFGVAIGDVTGKGAPAALLTALVQGLLAAAAVVGRDPRRGPGVTAPDDVIALVNRVLLARPIESRFVSLFLSVLSPDGQLQYCNAGQNPPLLFTRDGIQRLETGGTLIGAFPEAVFQRDSVQLAPGDTLVLYSDGVSEAANRADEEFGEDRIRAAVDRVLDQPPQQVLDTLFADLRTFTHGTGIRDDMTAVVVRYLGRQATDSRLR